MMDDFSFISESVLNVYTKVLAFGLELSTYSWEELDKIKKIIDDKTLATTSYGSGYVVPIKQLDCIARILLIGVYDDNNIWSQLRGMRYIVKQIWQYTLNFNK
eukprot:438495_1